MNNRCLIYLILFSFMLNLHSFAQDNKEKKEKKAKISKSDFIVVLSTQFGDVKLLLYEETPKHRENFLKLVKEGFYNNLLFHRVIKEFMIQGGDPESKNAVPDKRLGSGGLPYKIDAEFNPKFIHKKGALAAARDNNPQKASSSCQFYIVQGKKISDAELANKKYTDKQKEIYKSIGGTPFLDNNYTVFGEVLSGLEIIDKIAQQETDPSTNRPRKDVQMSMKIEKLSKKKITKLYGYLYE